MLKILDFTSVDISKYWFNDKLLDDYFEIYSLGEFVSEPCGSDGDHIYIFTQLMAEELLRNGYGGIKYKSSFTGKSNYTIFSPGDFVFEEGSSVVVEINKVVVRYEEREILNSENKRLLSSSKV
ncbi:MULTISPECIES: hypothetical protein [Sphingobacterium]|uniref:hypothetical protein n=1 Tax=Sphingobacterium TaxID=28453 RepID=UPI0013DA49E5|nr:MULTISPECIES: hypothetical protein [unclassified Sphingobacterium]